MKRKFVLGILTVVCAFSLIACGANKTDNSEEHSKTPETQKQTDTENESDKGDKPNTEDKGSADLKELFPFMGYTFNCPEEIATKACNNGYIMEYKGCLLFVEAPATTGNMVEVTDLEAAPEACKESIYQTIEGITHYLFDAGTTEQKIDSTKVVENNGIQMLRAEGEFYNSYEDTHVSCVVYYFLAGDSNNLPVYMYGFSTEGKDVTAVVDEMAGYIKK